VIRVSHLGNEEFVTVHNTLHAINNSSDDVSSLAAASVLGDAHRYR